MKVSKVRHAPWLQRTALRANRTAIEPCALGDSPWSWERQIDEDGAEPPGERAHRNRTARLNQDPFDLSWELTAKFGTQDGAVNKEILDAYVKALFEADWSEAKGRVGDTVSMADLTRTPAQRRADALTQIFADAAANEAGMAPRTIDHTVVWDESTFEEAARRFFGAKPQPFDVDNYRCETVSGHPLDPIEAFASAVVNKIRRLVVDAKGIALHTSEARFFTGLVKDAIQITGKECYWPGCWHPATNCETDHLHDHAKGGRTCPGNGAPACGLHNRTKQQGFTVWRDNTGQIQIQRPNGTLIE